MKVVGHSGGLPSEKWDDDTIFPADRQERMIKSDLIL
jgi:hypothetical protein